MDNLDLRTLYERHITSQQTRVNPFFGRATYNSAQSQDLVQTRLMHHQDRVLRLYQDLVALQQMLRQPEQPTNPELYHAKCVGFNQHFDQLRFWVRLEWLHLNHWVPPSLLKITQDDHERLVRVYERFTDVPARYTHAVPRVFHPPWMQAKNPAEQFLEIRDDLHLAGILKRLWPVPIYKRRRTSKVAQHCEAA